MRKERISAGLIGGVFGFGLGLSGMTNPQKVLNFLDVTGSWDPSLLLVMAAAVAVSVVGVVIAKRRERAVLGQPIELPTNRKLDPRLLIGAALFGVGWGLAGFCPGPALASLGYGVLEPLVFCAAMFAGFGLHRAVFERS